MITASLLEEIIHTTRTPFLRDDAFTSVSTDTRKLKKDALFVPLIGEHFNGHDFIFTAIESGAKAALWQIDQEAPTHLPDGFQLYIVKDTLNALQQLAKNYRQLVNPIVIGVTGSNGKTTTKDMMQAILSEQGETYKTQGNYNNHIGLPLTVLEMPFSTKYLIVEMGMSGFGEISLLSQLAAPNIAIVTNIGESHMEQLGTRKGIAKAKMEIRDGLTNEGLVIVDGDEPLLQAYMNSDSVYSVGFSDTNDAVISNVIPSKEGYSFSYDSSVPFHIPLLGKHNVKNASYCIAVARKLGVSDEFIAKGLKNVSLSGMRLERMIGRAGETIINDAYNASPTSMIAAIETLKAIPHFQKRIAVLGDMFELGPEEEIMHREVAKAISAPLTHLLIIGERAKWIHDECKKINHSVLTYVANHKEEALTYLNHVIDSETVILFKASRGMKFEEMIEQLLLKGDD